MASFPSCRCLRLSADLLGVVQHHQAQRRNVCQKARAAQAYPKALSNSSQPKLNLRFFWPHEIRFPFPSSQPQSGRKTAQHPELQNCILACAALKELVNTILVLWCYLWHQGFHETSLSSVALTPALTSCIRVSSKPWRWVKQTSAAPGPVT